MKNRKPSGTTVLVLRGEYDLALKDEVRAAFDAVSDAPRVVLDFSDVSYVDSMIVHELVRLHNSRSVANLEREWIVVRNSTLQRVFEILHLASVFRVVEGLNEAIDKTEEHITLRHVLADNGERGLGNAEQARTLAVDTALADLANAATSNSN